MLTVAVLGLVEVRKDDERLSVPAGKTTEVLIRLALDAGTQVRSERLIEDLWSEQAPGVARNTLQSKVSQLRRVLGDPGLVRGAAGGYTLLVDPGRVDALAVLRQAESVAALRATGNVLAAQAESAIALAKFRGELLPDAGDGEWLAPHRARLEEVRLRLTEDNLAARLELGAAGELVGELEALVHEHPVREGLWMLLITALYRAGRQADALGAYRRVRHQFAENLGLDLGPQLRELEERVLAHDVELVERGRPAAAAAGNLPPLSASLVGRSADLSAITRLVREERLVTMVGPAGVGKTRLAVEVARRAGLAGGAWLARLETAHRPASLWQSIGDAFGLTEATDAVVLDRLHGGELLLVVDNCEHLIDLLHDPVDRILRASPRLRVLATSQVPLGTDGEAVRLVEPLTLADSVALFTQRASQQRSSFADHVAGRGQRATVEAVCRSLDGLPLAIELAAARTKVLTVQEIARRLDDRFTLLTDPMTSREPRRRTLRAAIAWSYDLLFPDDQRGLWALSCFSGGASLSAVETVLGALGVPPAVAVDVLDRLVDRSLATVDDDMRFHLLDSVRAFSVDRLLASGQTDVARRSHATWFAAAGADVERGIRGPRQPEQLAFVRKERANLDAALEWATTHDPVTALRLAVGFGWAWALLGAGPDAAQRIRDAVNAADADADAPDLSTGLLLAGWLEASGGDLDLATADLHRAAQLGDRQHHLVSQLYLGFVRSQQGRADDALELLTGCIAGFRELGLQWDEGAGWLLSAWAEIALGRLGAAKAACDRALHLLRPLGDQWALSHAEGMLGGLAQAEHRFSDAVMHLTRAAAATRSLGFTAAQAHHLANLGRAQEQAGNPASAVASLELSIATAHSTGDLRTAALAAARLGRVLRGVGEHDAARQHAGWAQRWYTRTGGGEGLLLSRFVLAALDVDEGASQADLHLTSVLDDARGARDIEVELVVLDALARFHAQNDHRRQAWESLDAADALLPAAAHLVVDGDRRDAHAARVILSQAELSGRREVE